MKKYFNGALIYAICALLCGVFYREMTKANGFTERTMLSNAHVHLFALGTVVYLIIALFSLIRDLSGSKFLFAAQIVYNVGLTTTCIMMMVRGVTQVLGMELSSAANGAIAGIAGLCHMCTGIGIVLLLISLKKKCVVKN